MAEQSQMTFEAFIISIGTAALISLGDMENPMTKKKEKDPQAAKNHIDILNILLDKTKNNLSEDENRLLHEMLYTLRMKYVQQTSKT